MKTFWTHPEKGATLVELFLLFIDTDFKEAADKILKLKTEYGSDIRTGLGISNDNLIHVEEIDSDRVTGEVFESYVVSNFKAEQEDKKKSVICVRCKNKKEAV